MGCAGGALPYEDASRLLQVQTCQLASLRAPQPAPRATLLGASLPFCVSHSLSLSAALRRPVRCLQPMVSRAGPSTLAGVGGPLWALPFLPSSNGVPSRGTPGALIPGFLHGFPSVPTGLFGVPVGESLQ